VNDRESSDDPGEFPAVPVGIDGSTRRDARDRKNMKKQLNKNMNHEIAMDMLRIYYCTYGRLKIVYVETLSFR
jgi:hypothetical protein